jgi:hypothetical protein
LETELELQIRNDRVLAINADGRGKAAGHPPSVISSTSLGNEPPFVASPRRQCRPCACCEGDNSGVLQLERADAGKEFEVLRVGTGITGLAVPHVFSRN